MKNRFVALLLIPVLMLVYTGCGRKEPLTETTTATSDNPSELNSTVPWTTTTRPVGIIDSNAVGVSIERLDFSIKNEYGKVLGIVFFDLPQMTSKSKAAKKINDFLMSEQEQWRNNSRKFVPDQRDMRAWLEEKVAFMREAFSEESLLQSPLEYSVTADIIYQDSEFLSIKLDMHWFAGGSLALNYYGYTFSKKTGDLLPFTVFADVEANAFKEDLLGYLTQKSSGWWKIGDYLGPNTNHDFTYAHEDRGKSDLSYEYYYDGTEVCLLLNGWQRYPVICKWNGKTGNDFSATL